MRDMTISPTSFPLDDRVEDSINMPKTYRSDLNGEAHTCAEVVYMKQILTYNDVLHTTHIHIYDGVVCTQVQENEQLEP